MGTITQDPLRPEALEGLKDPRQLLTIVNRIQAEAGAALNGGLTLENSFRVVLTGVEIVTPPAWTPLPALNGFADFGPANGYGSFAVRKETGGRVWVREAVARAAGAPAINTAIAQLPAGHAPMEPARRMGEATGTNPGVWDVTTSGTIRWLAGNPTLIFTVEGSWLAADTSIPAWERPVGVRLADERVGGTTTVREVLCVARTSDGSASILSTVAFPGASIQAPQKPGEPRLLVLPRIDGLREATRYTLTLWAFME